MSFADFSGADLSRCDFFFADVRSDFSGAKLVETKFFGADLTEANFTNANMQSANMTDAKITQAKFTSSQMQGAIGTNGRPWGFAVRPRASKKPWWKAWHSGSETA